jgi:caffeoyl-CoA O-methyltransferase
MFHNIPQCIKDRMTQLEEIDTSDRKDSTPHLKRLRQIPPETGRFLALMASLAPDGEYIEIGTSAGYSTMWLALACRQTRRKLTTFELLDEKAELARETIRLAEIDDVVNFVHGDAFKYLENYSNIAFCFLDAEKTDYAKYYDLIVPRLIPGGILIADNVISHAEKLQDILEKAKGDKRADSVIVPISKGELVCRKL